ncbi:hypothetical protein PTKIN_Ptkin05aG0149300 [Pterospermum kingtungense]
MSELLISGFWVSCKRKKRIWTEVKYEKLSYFCYGCGCLGYTQRNCDKDERGSYGDDGDIGFKLHIRASEGRSRVLSSEEVRFNGVKMEDLLDKGLFRNNQKCLDKSVEKVTSVDKREVLSKVKGLKVVDRGERSEVGYGFVEFRGVRIEELVTNLLNGTEKIKDYVRGSSVYVDVGSLIIENCLLRIKGVDIGENTDSLKENFDVGGQTVAELSFGNENSKQIVVYEEDQCNYIMEMLVKVGEVYAVVGGTKCEVSSKEFK